MEQLTTQEIYGRIARALIEFGYSGITATMIEEIHAAMLEGKTGAELPHGIIGMMAERQLDELGQRGIIKTRSLPL